MWRGLRLAASASWLLTAACHEYTVTLEQASPTPLAVVLDREVQMPAGILVRVTPRAERDGQPLSDVRIDLAAEDWGVLDTAPVAGGDDWALMAVDAGWTRIQPWVDGYEAAPIEVVVTEQ